MIINLGRSGTESLRKGDPLHQVSGIAIRIEVVKLTNMKKQFIVLMAFYSLMSASVSPRRNLGRPTE